MSKPTLKALDVEALTFIYPTVQSPIPRTVPAPRRLWRVRATTVGVAAAIALLVALAWALLPR